MEKLSLFVFLITLLISSCNYKKRVVTPEESNIIATIDSISISFDEVDNSCRQELFDQLSRIHLIRKIALDQIIEEKLLQLEANKQGVTVTQLTDSLYRRKISSASLMKFASLINCAERITVLRDKLISLSTKSDEGQQALSTKYKEYLLKKYVDSLMVLHDVNISLQAPKPPLIKIDDLIIHYKGNLKSDVTCLIISDFDCHMCREDNEFFERLYLKYKDKIRFGFSHYGSYVSKSAIASECAANQDRFWEMHDSIFSTKIIPDSVALFRIAKNLKLNMNIFTEDYKSKKISDMIHENLLKLESAGIYGTPTIMINNRLIFNNTSLNEIEQLLNEEISKLN